MRPAREERLERVRYFLLSFSAAFFVLSLLFLFLMTTVHPAPLDLQADSDEVSPEEGYVPAGEDALTVLFFGVETADAVAGTYLLARFDPVREGVTVAVLPPGALLGEETLEDCYRYGGAKYTRERLAAYLGVEIHRYARLSLSGFVQAAGAVGSVSFELEEDLALAEGETTVILGAGPQLLDGRKAAAILRHRDYPGGEEERCAMITRLVCAIVDQRIDVADSVLSDKIFSTVVNLIDTDISYADYEQRKRAASLLARKEGAVAYPLLLEGDYGGDGKSFSLYDTSLALIAGRFV